MRTNRACGIKIKAFAMTAAVVCLLLLFFIPARQTAAASKGSVNRVSVTNLPAKSLTLKKKKSFRLKTKVFGTGAFSKGVKFKSSRPKIVSVTSSGKLKARKKGTAKITITSKANKNKKIVITVRVGTPVSKVSLSKKTAELRAGDKLTLKATTRPVKASNRKVVWRSTDASVATVSSSGVVTGKKPGETTIQAIAADGSGKKASCVVMVYREGTAMNDVEGQELKEESGGAQGGGTESDIGGSTGEVIANPDDPEHGGTESQGTNPQGTESQGTESQGTESQGTESQGTESQGTESQGTESQGTESQGTESQGTESQGTESQGTESQGTESQGTESQGTESQGTESQGTETIDPEKYRALLKDRLAMAEALFKTPGAEIQQFISDAKAAAETSEDGEALKALWEQAKELVRTAEMKLTITDISGPNVLHFSCEWEESTAARSDLLIEGSAKRFSSDGMVVTLNDASSTWSLVTDSAAQSGWAVTVTNENGMHWTYPISYTFNPVDLSIGEVSLTENGTEMVTAFWEEEAEGEKPYVLCIEGLKESMPENLVITGTEEDAVVSAMTASDLPGYDGMLTVSVQAARRTYYVLWSVPTSAFDIEEVYLPLGDGQQLLPSSVEEIEEDGQTLHVLTVSSVSAHIPEKLQLLMGSGDYLTVDIYAPNSDKYDGMFTIDRFGCSDGWYLKLDIIGGANLAVKDISAKDANGNSLILDWTAYEPEEAGDVYLLEVNGLSETVPETLQVVPASAEASVTVSASDNEDYEAMATITSGSESRTWYISYMCVDDVFSVADVTGTGIGLWEMKAEASSDGSNTIYYLSVEGEADTIPSNLKITPESPEAQVSAIFASDKSGFDRMFTISALGFTRTWYIRYNAEISFDNAVFTVNGEEIEDWYTDDAYDKNTGAFLFEALVVFLANRNDAAALSITSPDFTFVSSAASDRAAFDRVVTLKDKKGGFEKQYYVKVYLIDEEPDEVLVGAADIAEETGDAADLSGTAMADPLPDEGEELLPEESPEELMEEETVGASDIPEDESGEIYADAAEGEILPEEPEIMPEEGGILPEGQETPAEEDDVIIFAEEG